MSLLLALTAAAGGITAVAVDSIAFTDSATATSDRLAAAADAIALTDSAVGSTDRLAVAVDAIALTDSAVAISERVAVASDGVTLTDSAVAVFVPPSGLTADASDTVAFSDAGVAVKVAGTPVDTATPGRRQRLHLRAHIRGEAEEAKRLRRILQGIEAAPVAEAAGRREALARAAAAQAGADIARLQAAVARQQFEIVKYRSIVAAAETAAALEAAEQRLREERDRLEVWTQELAAVTEETDIVFVAMMLADA